ncbi:PAS domain-containing sensor histidine kinase [Aerosakkonema funiforme]|uniref:PAS domain-containing sensor histidine kinase n=1 Tax=Aerosakkonema funiforme TaxID=1246630 RepID=UPI0035B77274
MTYKALTKQETEYHKIRLPYEELFEQVVENAPAAIAILDSQMRYVKVSKRWLKDYQLKDGNIIGESHYQVYGGDPEHWQEIYQRCQTGIVHIWEEELPQEKSDSRYKIKWEAQPWYVKSYSDIQDDYGKNPLKKGDFGGIILFAEKIVIIENKNNNYHKNANFFPSKEEEVEALIANIYECRQSEIALRESQEHLKALITNTPIILYAIDNNGVFIVSEGKGLEAIGKKPGEVVGQSVFDLYADRPDILEQINHVLAGAEGSWITDFGSVIFENKATPLRDINGQKLGLIGTATDITCRVKAEVELTQQVQREKLLNRLTSQIRNSLDFNTVIETAVQEIQEFLLLDRCQFVWYLHETSEPYWDVEKEARHSELPDLRGRYKARKIGALAEQLLRLQILQIDDVENVSEPEWKHLLSSLGFSSILAMPTRSLNGAIAVINCVRTEVARPWNNSEVELLSAVMNQLAIAINQAELYAEAKEKAEELERSLHKLKTTQSQLIHTEKISNLGQLVAGIAHEVNNPVAFICGNLHIGIRYTNDLLKHLELYRSIYPNPPVEIEEHAAQIDIDFISEDLPKMLSSMVFGTDRIRDIMQSLRNFSRVEETYAKPVNIHEGLDSTLTILQHRLKKQCKRPAIKVIKEYGDLPLIECYSGQLNQVFMNILANAIDAFDEYNSMRKYADIERNPNMILIRTEMLDDFHIVIRIKDNGPGIPESVVSRLFDPFFTTKAAGKGTGLGLSISHQIVTEIHKGQIRCISVSGQGTEFAIEIPIEQQPTLHQCTAC